MNTEYKKLLLESLEKIHQNIDRVTLESLPDFVHAEVEILTMFENADQATRSNEYRKEDKDEADFLKRKVSLGKKIKAIRLGSV
jgi:hypothetical protein